jgi:hypothetical protein
MHGIILDEIDSSLVDQDIRLYVEQSLDGRNWTIRDPWKATSSDVDEITGHAGGLFVFAATAVRYICTGFPQHRPQRSLDYLLKGAPLTHLHDIYRLIINEAIAVPDPNDDRARDSYDRATKILGTILHLFEPLDSQSLATLLDMDMDDLRIALLPLSAVIRCPDTPGTAIQIIHLSFREFVTAKISETRPDLLRSLNDQQHSMISFLVRVMECTLTFNICDLPTSYLWNIDMPNLKWRLNTYLPGHLKYACRFWVSHLDQMPFNATIAQRVAIFLFQKFLFWLETLSLLGMVGHASRALSKLISWASTVRICFSYLSHPLTKT